MRDETLVWLEYAQENLASAKVLSDSELYNPCLQNVQQSIEKSLKALFIENAIALKKTHSISQLKNTLSEMGVEIKLSDDECDFLDSIYLPSKYPLGNVLPYHEPDLNICNNAIHIAERVFMSVENIVKEKK